MGEGPDVDGWDAVAAAAAPMADRVRQVTDASDVPTTPAQRQRQARQGYAAARRHGGPAVWPTRADGIILSAADLAVLYALPRYGVLSWRQICRHFYNGQHHQCAKRLQRLRDCGLIEQTPHEGWPGVIVWASATTHTLTNRDALVPLTPSSNTAASSNLLHKLAVNDIGLRYETRGRRVLTEREVRAVEQGNADAADLAAAVGSPGTPVPDGHRRLRYFATPLDVHEATTYLPDLVVVTDTKLIAVEIELTVKERARGYRIMRSYNAATPFTDVFYMCTPEVEAALRGYWRGGATEWVDGWLQHLRVLPRNTPWDTLDPADVDASRIKVFPLEVSDDAIQWQLDMREVPRTVWVSKREWRTLRNIWATHPTGRLDDGQPMAFLTWWRTQWPTVQHQRRTLERDQWRGPDHHPAPTPAANGQHP